MPGDDPPPRKRWDENNIESLLTLEPVAPLRFRSRYGDSNLNGRSYGGQVLGQAIMAAAQTVPDGRAAASYHLTFLRGADPHRPIDFVVTLLQDGARFSARHVLGMQNDGQIVLSANATFAVLLPSAAHHAAVAIDSDPDTLEDLVTIPDDIMEELRPLGPYSRHVKPSIDFRIPDIDRQLRAATAQFRFRYWMRSRGSVANNLRTEAAVFAYMSDWWLNFSSLSGHLRDLKATSPLYIASLNHNIWFHQPFSPSDWMFVESESPASGRGRGLSIAKVCNRDGVVLATLSQESLMIASHETRG